MANSTVATIIGYGLQAAKTSDSTRIPGLDVTTALVRIVDRENRNFILAPYQLNQPGWDFMINERAYTLQSGTTITGALTPISTTVPVTLLDNFYNASDVLSTFTVNGGAAVIYNENIPDVFLFGGASGITGAGNLTTVTQLGSNHASGEAIYTLYRLPSDFGRTRQERDKGQGVTLNTIPMWYGGTGEPWRGNSFSIFVDSVNDRSYLWMPRDASGNILVRYDKRPTNLSLATQQVDVPVDYEEYLIQKVAAHVLRILSKDDTKIADAEDQAMNVMNMAFARRAINKRARLVRGPIRSPSSLSDLHYMSSSGEVF